MDNLIDEFQAQIEMIKDNHYLTDAEIIKRYEDKILTLKNPKLSYYFARNIKGANIKAHRKIVIESKNIGYNLLFALLGFSDIKIHEKIILKSKNLEYIYKFAKNIINGVNIQALKEAILESKDPEYNFLFACFIDKYDITDYYLTVLASGNKEYIELFRNLLPNSKKVNKHTGSEYVISKFTDELSKKLTYKK